MNERQKSINARAVKTAKDRHGVQAVAERKRLTPQM